MSTSRALVRAPTEGLQRALVDGPRLPIDVSLAMSQHAAIVEGLTWCGLEVVALPPLPQCPDACFVEDRAVVLGSVAVITRSAVESRAPEAASVARGLADWVDLAWMEEGTVDGGDVLRIGDHLWIGQSRRTDAAGTEYLAMVARASGLAVQRVSVDGLHLKCVCSAPAPDVLLYAEGFGLEEHIPPGVRAIAVPAEEAYAANAVGANGRVLVADGYPVTARRLEAAGLEVRRINNSEFAKRDGSLTCLSILLG